MTPYEQSDLFSLLHDLESNIGLVLNASLPNKQQHTAALKMSATYFARVYDSIQNLEEGK